MDIENILKCYGVKVEFVTGENQFSENCFFQPIRQKSNSSFSHVVNELGVTNEGYYLLIAPGTLSVDSGKVTVKYDGKNYRIKKSDKILIHDSPIYFWGILTEV